MEELPHICLYCDGLMGCPHLKSSETVYILDNLITEEDYRECTDWATVERRQKNVRDLMYGISGARALGVLHSFPTIAMDALRQGEKDELMYDEIPDFQGMIRPGMTSTEREEQLQYQTDENGDVVIELDHEGQEYKLARPIYQLKAYAINPEGPVAAYLTNPKSAIFWHSDQALAEIIKAEVGLGFIIKDKKATGKPDIAETNKETEMPNQGRKVQITTNRGPAAPGRAVPGKAGPPAKSGPPAKAPPAKAAPGKVMPPRLPASVNVPAAGKTARPPQRGPAGPGRPPGRPVGRPPAQAPVQEQEANEFPGGNELAELRAEVSALRDEIGMFKAESASKTDIAEVKELIKDVAAINLDLASKTGGTYSFPAADEQGNTILDENGNVVMNPLPQIFAKPSKSLAFVDGTAYDEDDAAGEDAAAEGE